MGQGLWMAQEPGMGQLNRGMGMASTGTREGVIYWESVSAWEWEGSSTGAWYGAGPWDGT